MSLERCTLALLIAGASCAPVRPSTKPLGGTETVEVEPHRDRRAAAETERASETAELDDVETVEVVAPPPKPAEPAAKMEPAPAAPATLPGVELSFPPLKVGDTVRSTLELTATLNVDVSGGPGVGANSGEIQSSGKAKIRVLKAAPARLEEFSVEFAEGKMRSKFQGATEEETLTGEKYAVSFSGPTPTAKDSKGQSADNTTLFAVVFMLEPLVELQARLGQGPQRLNAGWSDVVTLPHFRGLVPSPPDVGVGPLDLKLSAVAGAAPSETATFTLRLPITMTHDLGSGRVDLAGTCTLPARGLRPIDLVLAGPMTGSMKTPLADASVSGNMRYRARYDFTP